MCKKAIKDLRQITAENLTHIQRVQNHLVPTLSSWKTVIVKSASIDSQEVHHALRMKRNPALPVTPS